jgi:hypothetical protein
MRPCPCRMAPQFCRAPWRFPKMPAQAVASVQAQQHPSFLCFNSMWKGRRRQGPSVRDWKEQTSKILQRSYSPNTTAAGLGKEGSEVAA